MKNKKGIVLLMMLAMISFLAIVVMVCAFALSHEVNKDERYEITRQRMLEVKRALIGRLADISGGEDITSCGGFISDYGKPYDDLTKFDITELFSKQFPPWDGSSAKNWEYDNTDHFFWAGYRGERYLKTNAKDSSGTSIFIDGWGNLMQVRVNGDQIEVESWGSDGIDDGAIPPATYDRDIVDTFYWRRDVEVIDNTGIPNVDFRVIYPFQGEVAEQSDNVSPYVFGDIPVGLRKIEVRDGVGDLQSIKMVCIPPGANAYPITID